MTSEMDLEVRYYETDLMGIVHHSNYVRYFECGRNRWLQEVGIPIGEIERAGIMMPVVSVECNYKLPARMGDILHIVTTVDRMPMARITVFTKIYNKKEGNLLCDGKVVLGFIHSDTRRPTRAPQIFIDRIEDFFKKTHINR